MLIKANQWKVSDSSPIVSLDGMDSSSVHSADMLTTSSTTSSPEPYPPTSNHTRPVFTGTCMFVASKDAIQQCVVVLEMNFSRIFLIFSHVVLL